MMAKTNLKKVYVFIFFFSSFDRDFFFFDKVYLINKIFIYLFIII